MKIFLVCLCAILSDTIESHPYGGYRVAPQRTVMFGGYYGQPFDGRSYVPPGSMTAFASGDTIATNSFLGERYPPAEEGFEISAADEDEEATTEKRKSLHEFPHGPLADEDAVLEEDFATPKPPKRTPKRKPQKPQKPQTDEDEDEEEDLAASWPFQGGRRPSYNAFFPIMLGGHSGSKTRSAGEDGFYPGSATAIANSFSTGKGGVATSHATSFGDPYLSTLLRNGNFNARKARYGQTGQ